MFSPQGLFHSTPCPFKGSCTRPNCLFSHSQHVKEKQINIAYDDQPVAGPSNSTSAEPRQVVPAKRPAGPSSSRTTPASAEPPRKIVKTGTTTARPIALPAPSTVRHTYLQQLVALRLTSTPYTSRPSSDRGPRPQSQCCSVQSPRLHSPGTSSFSSYHPSLSYPHSMDAPFLCHILDINVCLPNLPQHRPFSNRYTTTSSSYMTPFSPSSRLSHLNMPFVKKKRSTRAPPRRLIATYDLSLRLSHPCL